MNNNVAPMPTQNPWAWVGMGMGTQCRAMLATPPWVIEHELPEGGLVLNGYFLLTHEARNYYKMVPQIQIEVVSTFLIIFRAHMIILFILK